MSAQELRSRAISLPGASLNPGPSSGDVEAVTLATVYVGDEVHELGEVVAGAALHLDDFGRMLVRAAAALGLSLIGVGLIVGIIVSDWAWPCFAALMVVVLVLGVLGEGGTR